jgi:hypothetical protein
MTIAMRRALVRARNNLPARILWLCLIAGCVWAATEAAGRLVSNLARVML